MAQGSAETPALHRETRSPATADHPRRGRIAARFLIAVAASATACAVWWRHQPRRVRPDYIVGYPTFANFDYLPSFLAYRLVIYAFPAGVLAVYSLLASRGPLRRPAGARRRRTTARMLDLRRRSPADGAGGWPGGAAGLGIGGRGPAAAPAAVVVVAVSAQPTSQRSRITTLGLWCGVAYLAGVLVLAAAIAWLRTGFGHGGRR